MTALNRAGWQCCVLILQLTRWLVTKTRLPAQNQDWASPHLPGSFGLDSELLEEQSISESIYRLPKAGVVIGRELAIRGRATHGLLLPGGAVTLDAINVHRFKNKEATVDPTAITFWLFFKANHGWFHTKL
jgi:hypothetical protein